MAFAVLSGLKLDALQLLYTFSPLLAYSILLLATQDSWEGDLEEKLCDSFYNYSVCFSKCSPFFGVPRGVDLRASLILYVF